MPDRYYITVMDPHGNSFITALRPEEVAQLLARLMKSPEGAGDDE